MTGKFVKSKKVARSITGISTPVFGISWNPPEDQREIIRDLINFLEDKRALFYPYDMENGPWVEWSVLEIRKELTETLRRCSEDSEMVGPLQAMRAACRKYLDSVGRPDRRIHVPHYMADHIWLSLGELRGIFGIHLAWLCAAYGIDAPADLKTIFPLSEDDDRDE